jgi:hypothetical protein
LKEENNILRRKIERCKELSAQHEEAQTLNACIVRKTNPTALKDEPSNLAGILRSISPLTSPKTVHNSGSAFEISRFETLTQLLFNVNRPKTSVKAMVQFIKAIKASYNPFKSITVFVVDRFLQGVIFKNINEKENRLQNKKKYKICSVNDETIYAVFEDEEDFSFPVFQNLEEAAEPVFKADTILIPIIEDGYIFLIV